MLRYESHVATGRRVLADVEVGGTEFKEGDRVLVLFGSASRDEDEFADAGRDHPRPGRRTGTWPSGSGRTAASAPTWPASSW